MLRFVLGALLAIGLAWLAGFAGFVRGLDTAPPLPAYADGIVALTGGAARIPAAVRLLREGRAGLLLISGVGHEVSLGRLAPEAADLATRITLGRAATSTVGNAAETAGWARLRGLHSLLIVTATYHMQRALIEIGRALPDVKLYAAPVRRPAGFGLLAVEYTKLLAARTGLGAVRRAGPAVALQAGG